MQGACKGGRERGRCGGSEEEEGDVGGSGPVKGLLEKRGSQGLLFGRQRRALSPSGKDPAVESPSSFLLPPPLPGFPARLQTYRLSELPKTKLQPMQVATDALRKETTCSGSFTPGMREQTRCSVPQLVPASRPAGPTLEGSGLGVTRQCRPPREVISDCPWPSSQFLEGPGCQRALSTIDSQYCRARK